MTDLRECPNPRCANARHITVASAETWNEVICGDCGMRGPNENTRDEAIALWNALPREERWVPVEEDDSYPNGGTVLDIWTSEGRCFEGCVFYDQHGDRGLVFDGLLDNDQGDWLSDLLNDAEIPTHWRRHTPPKGPTQ